MNFNTLILRNFDAFFLNRYRVFALRCGHFRKKKIYFSLSLILQVFLIKKEKLICRLRKLEIDFHIFPYIDSKDILTLINYS